MNSFMDSDVLAGNMTFFDWTSFLLPPNGEGSPGDAANIHDVKTAITKEYRFTEPYIPEGNDFHALPLSQEIEFAEICTGPPYSVGDATDLERRRRSDNLSLPRRRASVSNARSVSDSYLNITSPPKAPVDRRASMPTTKREHDPPRAFALRGFQAAILNVLLPSPGVQQRAREFHHLNISDVPVPLTYLRAKIPEFYAALFLDERDATHELHLQSGTHVTQIVPVHDLVLVAQCLELRRVIKPLPANETTVSGEGVRKAFLVEGIPHMDSFGTLLRWLYTNDEEELFEALKPMEEGALYGFAMNCRFWGVIDARIRGVMQALFGAGYGVGV
jgi:hypothetical protein